MSLAVAAALVGLAGPVSAAPDVRPPGVPPPVNPRALPGQQEVDALPYVVNNSATEQIGWATQKAACVKPLPGSAPDIEVEPPSQQRLRIREAQKFATGRGKRVAVIDSGVYPHPRLFGRYIDGGDYIEGRTGLSDCDGHGTAVAGIIAAAADPATGFVGVAPDAEILAIRQGSSFYQVRVRDKKTNQEMINDIAGDTVSLARAVVRAVQHSATVINISEAACFSATADQVNAADLQAAVRYAVDRDVVVVVAAANESPQCEQNAPGVVTTISSPGWFDDDVLTVAAADQNGDPADFSIRGPWVDVAAPGTGAVSLAAGGPGLTSELVTANGQRTAIDGTSFATPYVAGLAALVQQRFPKLTARQVMHRIEQTAQHTAGPGGRSEALGYGMINPVAALTAVLPEEQGADPKPAGPARLEDITLPQQHNPLARTIALVGTAIAVGLLGLTLLVVYTVRWHQRYHAR